MAAACGDVPDVYFAWYSVVLGYLYFIQKKEGKSDAQTPRVAHGRPMSRDQWEAVEQMSSMQECKDLIKGGLLPGQDGPALSFCWNPTRPGNGVQCARFVCRSHKECPFQVRAVMLGGSFFVQTLAGVQHSSELTGKTRLNGSLTTDAREKLRELVDGGAKPAAILSSLTAAELRRCEEAKIPVVKRPTGGLAGAHRIG